MRTIEFRGKDIDTGEWRYGDLQHSIMGIVITYLIDLPPTHNDPGGDIKREYTEVIPETVGQFTGLTDKNDNKIFEGDVLQKWETDFQKCEELKFEYDEEPMMATKKDVATMERFPTFWMVNESFGYEGDDLEDPNNWEIIGNIHDNFELI